MAGRTEGVVAWKAAADERARATMSFIFACVGWRVDWRFARRGVIVSWEQPRSDAVGWRPARRVVDAWEQLRSVALRAARGRHALARALPKGLQLAREADFASDFSCASHGECKERYAGVYGR